jgi:hypothetical protein
MISSALKPELQKAPKNVCELLDKYNTDCFEHIELTNKLLVWLINILELFGDFSF